MSSANKVKGLIYGKAKTHLLGGKGDYGFKQIASDSANKLVREVGLAQASIDIGVGEETVKNLINKGDYNHPYNPQNRTMQNACSAAGVEFEIIYTETPGNSLIPVASELKGSVSKKNNRYQAAKAEHAKLAKV